MPDEIIERLNAIKKIPKNILFAYNAKGQLLWYFWKVGRDGSAAVFKASSHHTQGLIDEMIRESSSPHYVTHLPMWNLLLAKHRHWYLVQVTSKLIFHQNES